MPSFLHTNIKSQYMLYGKNMQIRIEQNLVVQRRMSNDFEIFQFTAEFFLYLSAILIFYWSRCSCVRHLCIETPECLCFFCVCDSKKNVSLCTFKSKPTSFIFLIEPSLSAFPQIILPTFSVFPLHVVR